MNRILFALGIAMAPLIPLRADLLNLANGDRYVGHVELVNQTEVHLKSDVVGLVKIPRDKVVSIYFGTNQPSASVAIKTELPKNEFDPKAIEQVQREFLTTATPEANAMFQEMVQGLASGKLSVDDLRAQARDSLKQLRDLQAEIGEEDDNPLLQSYVGILERFINAGTNRAKTAAPKVAIPPPPKLDDDE